MEVFERLADVRAWRRAAGPRSLGFVPTMGALHEGHLALVARARRENDAVAASIFVNPLQFDDPEDLARYPRTTEEDLAALAAAPVDAVYLGSPADLYPDGFQTFVEPEGSARRLEGAHRAGHFRGVATIVLKLLNLTRADRAYFGEKDFQQLNVVTALVRDLHVPCAIVPCPTVRERDGLALSSRNRRLSPEDRARALALVRALETVRALHAAGERSRAALEGALCAELAPRVDALEYAVLVDPETLEPAAEPVRRARALVACRIGAVRLIDNAAIGEGSPPLLGGEG